MTGVQHELGSGGTAVFSGGGRVLRTGLLRVEDALNTEGAWDEKNRRCW